MSEQTSFSILPWPRRELSILRCRKGRWSRTSSGKHAQDNNRLKSGHFRPSARLNWGLRMTNWRPWPKLGARIANSAQTMTDSSIRPASNNIWTNRHLQAKELPAGRSRRNFHLSEKFIMTYPSRTCSSEIQTSVRLARWCRRRRRPQRLTIGQSRKVKCPGLLNSLHVTSSRKWCIILAESSLKSMILRRRIG